MTESEKRISHRPIRILFVARSFPPQIGGIETYLFSLWNSLRKRAEVRLLVIQLHRYLVLPTIPLFILAVFLRTLRQKPDIVYFDHIVLGPLAGFVSRFLRWPTVTTLYGREIILPNPIYRVIVEKATKWFTAFVAISRSTKMIAEQAKFQSEKIRVIVPGARIMNLGRGSQNPHQLPKPPYILTVGRLIPRKGVFWFLKAVYRKLLEKLPEVSLVIAGNGSDYERIRKFVNHSPFRDSVHLMGAVSDEYLTELYRHASCFVMPNIPVPGDAEGFGLVIVEASLSGTPVVASKLEGIQDAVVAGVTGLLAQPLNADDFVRQIDRVLQDDWQSDDRKQQLIQTAHAMFSWSRVGREYIDLFREAMMRLHSTRESV